MISHNPEMEAALALAVPFDLMKFTLTYSGPLPAAANGKTRAKEKWAIRKYIQPQLAELFQTHPVLKGHAITAVAMPAPDPYPNVMANMFSNLNGPIPINNPLSRTPKEIPVEFGITTSSSATLYMIQHPVVKREAKFIPLVRKSLGLACELDITFLRKEEPGSLILQGGDLDNRLKTLFDALKVPGESDMEADKPDADPFYCLLEEDALITSFSIKTDRLLTRPQANVQEVHLVIGVNVRVLQITIPTLGFLSD